MNIYIYIYMSEKGRRWWKSFTIFTLRGSRRNGGNNETRRWWREYLMIIQPSVCLYVCRFGKCLPKTHNWFRKTLCLSSELRLLRRWFIWRGGGETRQFPLCFSPLAEQQLTTIDAMTDVNQILAEEKRLEETPLGGGEVTIVESSVKPECCLPGQSRSVTIDDSKVQEILPELGDHTVDIDRFDLDNADWKTHMISLSLLLLIHGLSIRTGRNFVRSKEGHPLLFRAKKSGYWWGRKFKNWLPPAEVNGQNWPWTNAKLRPKAMTRMKTLLNVISKRKRISPLRRMASEQ